MWHLIWVCTVYQLTLLRVSRLNWVKIDYLNGLCLTQTMIALHTDQLEISILSPCLLVQASAPSWPVNTTSPCPLPHLSHPPSINIFLQKLIITPPNCVGDTLQPLYNTVCYNTILDVTQFKDGSQKCIDYIEKWP